MENKTVNVGVKCFFKGDLAPSKKSLVLDLCDRLNAIAKCKFHFNIEGTNKLTRMQKYTRMDLLNELEFAIEQKYKYLYLDGPYAVSYREEERILDASIDLYREKDSTLTFECMAMLPNVKVPIELFFKFAATLLNCQYGVIFINDSYAYMLHELSGLPGSYLHDYSEETRLWEKELKFYRRSEDMYSNYIRKAYWGNFLNAIHVSGLGGFDLIRRDAPAFLVEELPDGGAYIQLMESPYDFFEPDYKERLIKLDDYLSPIILPGRPEVQWDYYDIKRF